jgi:DNA-binding NarL/FixJ family response regulator
MEKINILIADDHQLIIDGIRSQLRDAEDIQVAAEAGDGRQVLKALEQDNSIDIVLMDINMPGMDGLECTEKISARYPQTRVIALSQYDEKRFVKRMIKNGAMGYLLKDAGREQIIEGIRAVYRGEKYFSRDLSVKLLEHELREENRSGLFPKLSSREKEVLELICQGFSTQEISDRLFISFHTVESHRANLMHKAGVKNTAGLVSWTYRNGIFD